MARGNDSEAAAHELADKFGQGVGNAEQLIDASLGARPREFNAAEILPRDEEKTREVKKDLGKLDSPKGTKVVDAAVRGTHTTIVYEDETGRLHLGVLDDKGKYVGKDAPPESLAVQSDAHSTPNKSGDK